LVKRLVLEGVVSVKYAFTIPLRALPDQYRPVYLYLHLYITNFDSAFFQEQVSAADDSNFVETGNCNDPKLKKLIVKVCSFHFFLQRCLHQSCPIWKPRFQHIQEDAQKSKRAIQKAAEDEFGGTFNVICSPCEFSFLISSQRYCDGMKEQVIACFAFLQPPTTRKI
uniref:Ground-like domain-containing protein n=1 Tax=Nippostrongylus brasiliensis TaxID=27835 RepID=A0A0N4XHJ6_NIPBR